MKTTVQNENQTLNDRAVEREFVAPEVDIFETRDSYVLEAEMPGVNKDGLGITLEGNEITIVGRRASEPVNGDPIFRERHMADYRRVFGLDPAIDTAKITARMEQGVLRLTLPKFERVKPRKITVD